MKARVYACFNSLLKNNMIVNDNNMSEIFVSFHLSFYKQLTVFVKYNDVIAPSMQ